MPVIRKCSFCGKNIPPGRGLMYVQNDGTINIFCTSKCERNAKLGRKSHKVRWTERYRKSKGKK